MAFCRSWRISSTPVFDAPSISITSISSPLFIDTQLSHWQQGSGVGASDFRQLSALASIRAIVVLPTPRVPVKRYACATCPVLTAFFSVCEIGSCPTTSSNLCDLYRLANTVYDISTRCFLPLTIPTHSAILPVVGSHASGTRESGQAGNRAAISDCSVVPWQTRPFFLFNSVPNIPRSPKIASKTFRIDPVDSPVEAIIVE